MAPIAANHHHHGDSQLEAGLPGTRQEEKIPFITPASNQVKSTPDFCPSERQGHSGKMSPRRRVTLIFTISLLVGLGFALARNPSLTTTCIRWGHGPHQESSNMARSALNKRQDGSLTNVTTTPGPPVEQSKTPTIPEQSSLPVVVRSSSPPLPATPTPSTTPSPSPSPPAPKATPTSASTKPQQPVLPPPASTNSPAAPSTTLPIAVPPSQIETSSPPRNPESPGTSTTRQGLVSASSSSSPPAPPLPPSSSFSSSVVQVSTSSRSTKAESTSILGIASSPFHHDITTTTPDIVPTTPPFQKTITAGRVLTSSPVPRIWTTTLEDGGVLTITSTSWVAIVPTEKPTSSSEPKLQNVAPKLQGGSKLVLVVGAATLGMLLF